MSQIEQQWIVGRGSRCDVIVRDEFASPEHCVVARWSDGTFTVTDLMSTNGTYIQRRAGGQQKCAPAQQIFPGDTLIVGRSRISWRA